MLDVEQKIAYLSSLLAQAREQRKELLNSRFSERVELSMHDNAEMIKRLEGQLHQLLRDRARHSYPDVPLAAAAGDRGEKS
jgi:hypothetical protein